MSEQSKESPCVQLNCSNCCSPVLMRAGFAQKKDQLAALPFKDRKERWIPREHADSVRLDAFDCDWHDPKYRIMQEL